MDLLYKIDWSSIFIPTSSVLEMVFRGTLMYIGMFILLRIFRRQAGSVSIADLLLIVIIADAAQNGMAGEAKSVTEAFVLIITIVFWDYTIDWLGFKSRSLSKVLEPQPVLLVRNGKMLQKNMDSELVTEDELLGQLRQQGIDDISNVRKCFLESNGEFSVLTTDDQQDARTRKKTGGAQQNGQ
jgi:uncharacterized membrane protein YcaP (DUF421 family)